MKKILKLTPFTILMIISIIIIMVLIVLHEIEVIDLKDLVPVMTLHADDSVSIKSPTIEHMLQSCQEIAQFYSDNGYTYNKDNPPWDTHYKDAQYRTSCCSIYVLQVFVDIGLTDSLGDLDAAYVGEFCKSHPEDWDQFYATTERDLERGDVQVYVHHTNIYAGWNEELGMRRILGCRRYVSTIRSFYRTN